MRVHQVGYRIKGFYRLAQLGLALPSVSTSGRLIARAPDKMRHAPVAWMRAAVQNYGSTPQSPAIPRSQGVAACEALRFDDLAAFNRKLADWLLAYTTVLPYHSLGRQSPVQFLIHPQPECQKW